MHDHSTMSNESQLCENSTLKPGECIRPIMTTQTAHRLVEELYGLKIKKINELNAYDDKNYKVDVSTEDFSNPNIKEVWPHGYIFKVMNTLDSKKNHVEAQHEVQRKVSAAGIICTVPILDKQGRDKSLQRIYHEYDEGKETESARSDDNDLSRPSGVHIIRLLTFVPGQTIVNVTYTPELLLEVGQALGMLDSVLQGYSHPALTSYHTIWCLMETPKLRDFLFAVEEESKRALISSVLEAFDNVVLPLVKNFKRGTIHGDYNEQNILVRKSGTKEDGSDVYSFGGVIDFGDMTDSCLLFDVAIAITYMSLDSNVIDPMHIGGYVLAGYLPIIPLNASEWSVLKECVCARLCTSLVMGAYSHKFDPSNMYVLTTAKKGWDLLRKMWQAPKSDIYIKWQAVIKDLDPSIQVPHIEDIV